MIEPVLIQSYDRHTSLELSAPDVLVPGRASYMATLTNHAMKASVRTHDTDPDLIEGYSCLRPFFDDLASNWKGWTGEKSLESIFYGDLTIHASNDGLRHALLKTTLTEHFSNSDWSAAATIHLELGQLEVVAEKVNVFVEAIRSQD